MTPAQRDKVLHCSFERHVAAGGYAVRRGEAADCWTGVIEGLVKMSTSLPDGRRATLTGVTARGWAGEGTLLKSGPWRYDGMAVRARRLACVPRHCLEQLVATSLTFNRFLLGQLNARLSLFVGLVLLRVEFGGVTVRDLAGLRGHGPAGGLCRA